MQNKGKTIIRLDSRIEIDSNGAMRTIYRRREITPTHPDYEKEKALQEKFIKQNGCLAKGNS